MATKRKDGRYVQTITVRGKKVYFYGSTKAEINRKIMEYNRREEEGITFGKAADDWWREALEHLAHQSTKAYKPALARAKEEFGGILLKNILPKDISNLLSRLADAGYAQKTVSNQRLVVNLIFERAVCEGHATFNPCASVHVPKGLKKAKRTAAVKTDEQIVRDTADVWLFPFIALMTGMRKGEILALQWGDIDFDKDLIRVTKSVQHIGDRPSIKAPKTKAGHRVVPLLPALKAELLKRKGKVSDYIISDSGKEPLTNRRYITLMDSYRRSTGVSATAHQLRHSFATIAFESDVPAKALQEILGHKQLSTTMDIYTDFREESVRSAADLLKAKLG